jgi:predicted dehydrogenase
MSSTNQQRREFLKQSTVAASAAFSPYFFSSPQTLADETRSPNDRFRIGVIGSGGMAGGNMNAAKEWLDVVAIADVDERRRKSFSNRFSGGKADTYNDYRKVIERDDVDVIHVATPDHWHTKTLVESMLAGKDVYCEKPMTLTIDEGKLIRRVQQETGRIVQVGTQQRSSFNLFVKAMAIVQEGRLGRIKKLEVSIGGAPTKSGPACRRSPSGVGLGTLAGTGSEG